MKVLSIGNGCSSDAHTYLPYLAKAAGKELLLGNLCLEGATVEDHYRNYIDEEDVYIYETYLPNETEKLSPDGIALHEAVEDDDWDIITIQQENGLAGVADSYNPYLSEVAAYCMLMHPETKVELCQVWAYESGAPAKEFKRYYNDNQKDMYDCIMRACHEVAKEAEIETIIPLGRAFQIARDTKLGDRLTTDGCRLNELGQFLASCVMYEAIFGESPVNSPFNLPDYDTVISDLIKLCADAAF